MKTSVNRTGFDPCSQFFRDVGELCTLIRVQMETLDNVNDGDSSHGFLFRLVENLKTLDESSVKTLLEENEDLLKEVSMTLVMNKEIEVRDGFVFSRRGGAKLLQNLDHERRRRQSFTSTAFSDQDALLRLDKVKEMTDLNFIFSLNGYHLPYCESSKQRSMYEWFFSSFLHEVHSKFPEPPIFKLMQESIMTIYIVSELCVDLLECLFEIISMVRTKLKEVDMNSSSDSERERPRTPRIMFDATLLEHLQRCFQASDKVFNKFRSRKLLNSIASEADETWLVKFDNYKEAILEAVFVHKASCYALSTSIQDLRSTRGGRPPLKPEAAAFCNDLIIYIDSYNDFLNLFEEKNFGRRTLLVAREALIQLESEQAKSPRGKSSPREPQPVSTWSRVGNFLSLRKTPK